MAKRLDPPQSPTASDLTPGFESSSKRPDTGGDGTLIVTGHRDVPDCSTARRSPGGQLSRSTRSNSNCGESRSSLPKASIWMAGSEAGSGHVDVGVLGEVMAVDERAEDSHAGGSALRAQELRGLACCVPGACTPLPPSPGGLLGTSTQCCGIELGGYDRISRPRGQTPRRHPPVDHQGLDCRSSRTS